MIPTYKNCIEIIDNNPGCYFYENKYIINDYNISIFCYRYASYNNFMLPIPNKPKINALELKGISYIFDDNNKVFNHHLMLHKFWELDQYSHCKYDLFKNKKIKNVTIKEDGYMFTYIKLPNNIITSQCKKGFFLDTNSYVNEWLTDKYYNNFINYCLNNNIQPIFELIGNKYKRNVKYNDNKLVLIKLRNNKTGKYLNFKDIDTKNIDIIKHENFNNLNDIITSVKNKENFEGYVVHFEDDSMLKVKSDWWKNNNNN